MRLAVLPWARTLCFILSVTFLGACLCPPARAAEGDGTGGGRDDPLQLVSSSPADGERNVTLPLQAITLSFNKNVVNASVREANQRCFSLHTQDNQPVPIRVDMADDQIEPEKKRVVTLVPLAELKPGTTYTVRVAPELQSKSGATLGEELTISFSTAGEPASQPKEATKPVEPVEPEGSASVEGSGAPERSVPADKESAAGSISSQGAQMQDQSPAAVEYSPRQETSQSAKTEYPPAPATDIQTQSLPAGQTPAANPASGGTSTLPAVLGILAAVAIAAAVFIRSRYRKVGP
ncbi:MAG: Ig-like domain-containing protein [Clostridia bacterium]|jgi:hypothetical protein|nr:Ig-like domain-containing protein [Clostridia bacterium]MDH7573790.1 Ig-like domain-containing protein [Clostridia bacterium]